MDVSGFEISPGVGIGPGYGLTLFAGPCVIESPGLCDEIAAAMQELCGKLGINYVFKASFDKANRTSVESYRGPGLEAGLATLAEIKAKYGLPVLTDVHETAQIAPLAEVVDVIQIPAFLCRQTDLLVAAGESGRTIKIKKGQFMAPGGMAHAVEKVKSTGNNKVLLTERGTTFGYGNLVVDMRGLEQMRELGVPVVFDGTHSVQLPGGQGHASGGQRQFVPTLVRAAAAVGIDGLFIETHPNPEVALSDGPNMIPLAEMEALLRSAKAHHDLA